MDALESCAEEILLAADTNDAGPSAGELLSDAGRMRMLSTVHSYIYVTTNTDYWLGGG